MSDDSKTSADPRTVRVFISSTFRDMHAERDLLVREVFPALRERCRPLGIEVVDVDLRWGITADEALQGRTVQVCLEEIRNTQPYFIGLLGERYGWTPDGREESITATEVIRGVLSPRVDPSDDASPPLDPQARERVRQRSFFYFRDPGFPGEVPERLQADVVAESSAAATRVTELKQRVRDYYGDLPGHVYDGYPCRFAGIRLSYDLLDDEARSRLADVAGDDRLVDPQELAQLDPATADLAFANGIAYAGGLDALRDRIIEDLWSAIVEETGGEDSLDEAESERRLHATFAESRRRHLVGRAGDVAAIVDALRSNAGTVVHGPPGVGKSAVLARVARELRSADDRTTVVERYVGASTRASTLEGVRDSVVDELVETGLAPVPDASPETGETDPDRVARETIRAACSDAPLVIVLDGLDQLPGSARAVEWLRFGDRRPDGLHVLAGLMGERLDARAWFPTFEAVELDELDVPERRELVATYLERFRKRLDERDLDRLVRREDAGLPLYLRVACEELRVFPIFEQVSARVAALPEGLEALFRDVLRRIEADAEPVLARRALAAILRGRGGVTESEMIDYLDLYDENDAALAPLRWARVHAQLRPYLKENDDRVNGLLDFFHHQLRRAVESEAAPAEETHAALARTYLRRAGAESGFDTGDAHALSEAVYHCRLGELRDELLEVLGSFDYVAARVRAGQLDGLRADLGSVASIVHDEQTPSELRTYLVELDALLAAGRLALRRAGGGDETLTVFLQFCLDSTSDELRLRAGRYCEEREMEVPVRARKPWLVPVAAQRAVLELHERPISACAVGPRVFPLNTPRGKWLATGDYFGEITLVTIRDLSVALRLRGHGTARIVQLEFDWETKRLISAAADGTVVVWDVVTGAVLKRIDEATGFLVTPNHICTFVDDPDIWLEDGPGAPPVSIFDATTLERVAFFSEHRSPVEGMAYVQGRVLSWDREGVVYEWVLDSWIAAEEGDEEELESERSLAHAGNRVEHVTEWDGFERVPLLCTVAKDNRLRIWGPGSEEPAATSDLSASAYIEGMAVVDDTRVACWGRRLWIVDIAESRRYALPGHTKTITALVVERDPNGLDEPATRVVTADSAGHIRVWDPEDWSCTHHIEAHTKSICGLELDGNILISASEDGQVKAWDVETGRFLAHLGSHRYDVRELVDLRRWNLYASLGADGVGRVWHASAVQEMSGVAPHGPVCARATAAGLFVTGHSDGTVSIRTPGRDELHEIDAHEGAVAGLRALDDGNRIVSWGSDGTVREWSRWGDRLVAYPRFVGPRRDLLTMKESEGPIGVRDVSVLADGRLVASLANDDLAILGKEANTLLSWPRAEAKSRKVGALTIVTGDTTTMNEFLFGTESTGSAGAPPRARLDQETGRVLAWSARRVGLFKADSGALVGFAMIAEGDIADCALSGERSVTVVRSGGTAGVYELELEPAIDEEKKVVEPTRTLDLPDRALVEPYGDRLLVLSDGQLASYPIDLSRDEPLWTVAAGSDDDTADLTVEDTSIVVSGRSGFVRFDTDGVPLERGATPPEEADTVASVTHHGTETVVELARPGGRSVRWHAPRPLTLLGVLNGVAVLADTAGAVVEVPLR